jgi:hypothetical protein
MRGWLVKSFRVWLALMVFAAGFESGMAQELAGKTGTAFKDNWAIQLQPGFSQFYGDASNHNYFQKFNGETGLAAELSARKMIIPAVGVGLQLGYAGLKSYKDQKTDGTKVDFHLNGDYFDVGLYAYVNFNHLFAGYKPGRRFSAYGTIGLDWGFWNSALTDGITGLTIKSGSKNGSYTYKTNAFVLPVGAGVNWRINNRWAVNLGGTLRTVFNDDVDVWHDGFKYDQIFTTQVGVTYHIRSGWGGSGKQKASKKKNPCCNENEKKNQPVLPIYDFNQFAPVPAKAKPSVSEIKAGPPVIPPVKKVPARQNFEFRVQILATSKPVKDFRSLQSRYHLPYPVVETHQDGLYRYSVGSFVHYADALAAARKIKNLGIFDAFVTAYSHGLRIPLTAEMKK